MTTANGAPVKVITPQGHIRMGDAVDQLRIALDNALNEGSYRILVDMTGVQSLDSSGIGVLVRCHSLARQHGGALKLASVPEKAHQSMLITGVLKIFEIFPDTPSAMQSFQSSR